MLALLFIFFLMFFNLCKSLTFYTKHPKTRKKNNKTPYPFSANPHSLLSISTDNASPFPSPAAPSQLFPSPMTPLPSLSPLAPTPLLVTSSPPIVPSHPSLLRRNRLSSVNGLRELPCSSVHGHRGYCRQQATSLSSSYSFSLPQSCSPSSCHHHSKLYTKVRVGLEGHATGPWGRIKPPQHSHANRSLRRVASPRYKLKGNLLSFQ